MKLSTSRITWVTALALLLALPTAYFILIAILKYGLNIDGPFDSATPFLERMGIKQTLGWNINLLILFGPVLALVLTIFQVLKIKWEFTKEDFQFHFTVQKRWFPILVAAFSIGLLAILFFYMLGENCTC
ncbi:MAG: hypothetical protein M3O67_10380 [Bacteroidota bacterium]|nr:hypothetical protein [Bacteroidota bacterium]